MLHSNDSKAIEFLYKEENIDKRFKFDFRYYTPFTKDGAPKSGIYTFRTTDRDSRPYPHIIQSISIVD